MKLTLQEVSRITDTTRHHGFTDCCVWRGDVYVACRVGGSHGIVPKGDVVVYCEERLIETRERYLRVWPQPVVTLTHPRGDCRDPKFLVTEDVLYLFCGVYLPHPAQGEGRSLSTDSGDNLLQTHLTFTTDGNTWSAWLPILRPQYWGWSAVQPREDVYMASYHTGQGPETSSIHLSTSTGLLTLMLTQAIYEGASLAKEGPGWRYPQPHPSEPVLFAMPGTDMLGCAVRTGANTLTVGYGKLPYGADDWRWVETAVRAHVSAVAQTVAGTVLAGRAITPVLKSPPSRKRYDTTTALWELEGQRVTKRLTLPSAGDTGYAGIAQDGKILYCSYYSQHEVPAGLPGAAVYVATVEVSD